MNTAYEMRISDWSSDVCSSDLPSRADRHLLLHVQPGGAFRLGFDRPPVGLCRGRAARAGTPDVRDLSDHPADAGEKIARRLFPRDAGGFCHGLRHRLVERDARSEEHTSELQSLMRISYAVFCLKKK